MAEERRGKLDETLKLYQLQGEIDDLEQWIAEKEVVAGSQDIGQDLAQVEVHFSVLTINSIKCNVRTPFLGGWGGGGALCRDALIRVYP